MVKKVDKGMATKKSAIFKERMVRKKAWNKAKDDWLKAANNVKAVKVSHARKPDSSGNARVKKAEAAKKAATKARVAAGKHYRAKLTWPATKRTK